MAGSNRLQNESSPYLLQHAHNPVQWWPWCKEAFAQAASENKLVFLSVGYSTCHWCHVMAHESFEDEEIAAWLNEHFISIKVDREERPDIDAVYMTFVQMLAGHGGWPMTVFMTPEKQPIFGGTYFPARDGDRGPRGGFLSLIKQLQNAWHTRPHDVLKQADHLSEHLRASARPKETDSALANEGNVAQALASLKNNYDPEWGGFSDAPKFPRAANLEFLLSAIALGNDPQAAQMLTTTLWRMAEGGMYDQLAGGFHRYSVDEQWLVPHFEKMLYDNAQLARIYAEASLLLNEPYFARVARETLNYLTREMRAPEGVFYSATDADSTAPNGHMEEGWFYTWTQAEVAAVVGPERARLFCSYYDVSEEGNFEGRSILTARSSLPAVAARAGLDVGTLTDELASCKAELYAVRKNRPPPLTDTKIIAAWNALTISAFARAGFLLDEPAYVDVAAAAMDYLVNVHWKDKAFCRVSREGVAKAGAFLDDYAFLIRAALDLFKISGKARYFNLASQWQKQQDEFFGDAERGGYFFTAHGHEQLLLRDKPDHDGAEPAGNSVALANLLTFYAFTTNTAYYEKAAQLLRYFSPVLLRRTLALPAMAVGLRSFLNENPTIVAMGTPDAELLGSLKFYSVGASELIMTDENSGVEVDADVAVLHDRKSQQGKCTVYVCQGQSCSLPIVDAAQLRNALMQKRE